MKYNKADLHVHSTGSDGRHSVDYLLETYSKCGYDVVSITDHYAITLCDDKILKLKETLYNIKIIVGMEYAGRLNGELIHLLCYFNSNLDLCDEINDYMSMQREFIKCANDNFKLRMYKQGIKIPDIDYSILCDTSYEPILSQTAKICGKSLKQLKEEMLDVIKKMKFRSPYQLSIKDMIDAVHKSGGLVFVAHPFEFKLNTIRKAIALGVDGLEAIYGTYTKEQQDSLIRLCQKNNLIWTAGSDFHYDCRIDKERHGDIGSASLEGKDLERFMDMLTSKKRQINL